MEIKETKEAMVGMLKLATLLAVVFKDGMQAQDAVEVFNKIQQNDELKKALVEAYNGADLVVAEMKDLSIAEALDLLTAAIPEVKDLIAALSKKQEAQA